jgi:hypothetical protein
MNWSNNSMTQRFFWIRLGLPTMFKDRLAYDSLRFLSNHEE